jgi:hypothetical protein
MRGDLFGHDDTAEAIAKRDVTKLLDKAAAIQARIGEGHQAGRRFGCRSRQRTGLSESAVKVTVHRAIKSLGEELKEERGGDANR